MFSRNGLRSTFPSPGAIGVRAYGAAIEERIRERRLNRLHLQELRRQELQKEEQRKSRECLPNKTSQFNSGEYGGQNHTGKLEGDQKPVMNLRDALAQDSPSNRLFFAEEPQYTPVQMEHGDQSGEYQYEPLRESLFDCISNGVLDMDSAGRIIYEQKRRGDFDQAEYDVFVNSEDAMMATLRFDMDDLNDMDDDQVLWHNMLANRLMGEITHAHLQKISQSSKSIARAVITSSMPKVSLGNLSKPWRLRAMPPFVELDLVRLAERWFPRKNDNTFQQLTSLYRFILLHVTDPPYRIKEFAVRVNKGGSRNENLKDLPNAVQATLIGFGEDITGYGSGERGRRILNVNGSRSCTTWETSESMDSDSSAALSRERNEWQSHMLKSLQRALTDVRSYGYDAARNQWFSNNRQKQATMQEKESVAAYETVNTENKPATNSFKFN
ncbi:hypothetical protein ANCCAN_23278 [Ancylostoma caninum]|uniref:Uncharacterized protein n=1 Tax=Ancylostoma caninum TaxID=29170 RepID=A0A368FFP1_ANCCA|nr:hypothetical protein ANCCAN_23278 [Ancylostoma caninum]